MPDTFEDKADIGTLLPWGEAGRMSDDSILREKARNLLLAGILPDRPPDRMWGGKGAGVQCIVCSAPVTAGEVTLEIEYAGAGAGNHHVHVGCYSAVESERHRIQLSRSRVSASAKVPPAAAGGPMGDGHQ